MAEANQSIFSNRHIMVTQDATDLEVIQNGDNTEGIQNGDNTEEVANCSTRCETKYESFSKVCFKISWNKGCTEWNTYSTKTSSAAVSSFLQMIGWKKCSRLSGPRVFGFDIKPLHDACLQIHIKTFNTNNESCEQYTDEDDFDKINRKKNPSLFTSIELLNYVPDELHILLRITDFYHSNNNRSASWTWTSLMGPEKKKILQSFPVSEFVTGSHGIAIENLWCQFFNLYEMLRKPSYNEEDIIKFELEAKN
ncbi:22273_t:CDS:2 [Entrophospora sp. SA101]|nr:22273_t:CDS:2 [Entrophospora sp. SA101]